MEPQEPPAGPQEIHVAATVVANPQPLAEDGPLLQRDPQVATLASPDRQIVALISAGDLLRRRHLAHRLLCSAFRTASLASAMVASCCKRHFFALAMYSSVARICFSNGGTYACRFAFSNADCRTSLSSVSSGWRTPRDAWILWILATAAAHNCPGRTLWDWLTAAASAAFSTPARASQADELAAGILHVATASMVDACHGSLVTNHRGLPLGSIPS